MDGKQDKTTEVVEEQKDAKTASAVEMRDPSIPSSTPNTKYIDGFPVPGLLPENTYRSALTYKPRSGDIFIATYPKCGTTWAQHILLLIFNGGQPYANIGEFLTRTPYFEMTGAEGIEKMPRPGAIKSHLPYHLIPKSDSAKYIYIARNPKDCCVSYYHHMKDVQLHGFNGTFDDLFECFMSGRIDYGDYFDHLLGWYAHRNEPNILFMTYEEMKQDISQSILKMASFIDDEKFAQPLRNDPEKLKNVIHFSSFQVMKENFNKQIDIMFSAAAQGKTEQVIPNIPDAFKDFFSSLPPIKPEQLAPTNFIRKGIIGDWKNYFSDEQNRRLNEKFAERTNGTEISNFWKEFM